MLRASREKENPRGGNLWGFLHVKTGMDFAMYKEKEIVCLQMGSRLCNGGIKMSKIAFIGTGIIGAGLAVNALAMSVHYMMSLIFRQQKTVSKVFLIRW